MNTKIFVNLPVADLEKSQSFFKALGYSFNPQFSNEKGACLVIADDIYVMLLTQPFFKSFIKKDLVDAFTSTEVLLALSVDSREQVDEMMSKVLAAGGRETREAQEHGFMYARSFEDLDGHIWETFWMDPASY